MRTPITRKAWKQLHFMLTLTKIYVEVILMMLIVSKLGITSLPLVAVAIVILIFLFKRITKPVGEAIRNCYEIVEGEKDFIREVSERNDRTVTMKGNA